MRLPLLFRTLALVLLLATCAHDLSAQRSSGRTPRLPPDRHRSGFTTLLAFSELGEATRHSVVRLDVDGKKAALGTVVTSNGWVVTKATEIKGGKLMAWLPNGKEVEAELIAVDEENDIALVQIAATDLKPIVWAPDEATVGQWAVTPGLEPVPEAVGVISVPPRKIMHARAFVGVRLDFTTSLPKVEGTMPGFGAAKAGLQAGDVILAVNDKAVEKREELIDTLRKFRAGQTVTLRVKRDGEEFEKEVEMMAELEGEENEGERSTRTDRFQGELSRRAEGFALALQHDTVLQPWHCGGPLVGLDGKAIGVNIARAGRTASYALTAALVQQIVEGMKLNP